MEKVSCYPQVIRIILNKNYDPHAIILKLACDHPDIFLECHEGVTTAGLEEWQKIALPHIKAKNLITAIKEVRAFTGWGLIESKNAVEKFRDSSPHLFSLPTMVLDT